MLNGCRPNRQIPFLIISAMNCFYLFWWFSSLATGLIQALILKRDKVRGRSLLELLLTVTNVASFMIVYFYFDVQLSLTDSLNTGMINVEEMNRLLQINHFSSSFSDFLSDPAHIFILFGGGADTFSESRPGQGRHRIRGQRGSHSVF